jgi:hypothetical protein
VLDHHAYSGLDNAVTISQPFTFAGIAPTSVYSDWYIAGDSSPPPGNHSCRAPPFLS